MALIMIPLAWPAQSWGDEVTGASDSQGGGRAAGIRQAWEDLLSVASDAGYAVAEMVRPPATGEQLAAAERAIGRRLPPDLAALYQLSDGQLDSPDILGRPPRGHDRDRGRWLGPLFGDGWAFNTLQKLQAEYQSWVQMHDQYSPAELAEFDEFVKVRDGDPVKPLYMSADWIPFATDGGGNSLAADLAPEPAGAVGQVIVMGSDEDLRRVIAPNVPDLLRLCADRLRRPVADLYIDGGVAMYTLET
jgi:cell wall assembly regulator SMI1